jgi:hypothetical protein
MLVHLLHLITFNSFTVYGELRSYNTIHFDFLLTLVHVSNDYEKNLSLELNGLSQV